MAHSPAARAAVRAVYVHQNQPLEVAARRHGVEVSTARRWKSRAKHEGDDWDRARAISYMSGQGSETVLMSVLESIVTLTQSTLADLRERGDEIPPLERVEAISRLVDAYHKTAAAVAKNSPKLNRLALAMEILEKLADHISSHHAALAPALLEVIEPFGQEMARQYG